MSTQADVEKFLSSERFKYTTRSYGAKEVASLRGTIPIQYPSNFVAKKLYDLCRKKFAKGEFTHTFGALDPVQVVQMAKYLETVYVSGWQCSSTASTTNEPGPDFADYPSTTVPNKVDQLFRAQLFHDRKQNEARSRMTKEELKKYPAVDYLRPIIADGDTGFGGVTSVMKLVKLQIQAGAAAVHLEDQRPGAKKCGHMGGKVLVSMQEHIDRLAAARLQADIMGCETVFIARTDAASATFLDNNVDPRDHPFIAGCTNQSLRPLNEELQEALSKGKSSAGLQKSWLQKANLMRYPDAVAQAIRQSNLDSATKEKVLKEWLDQSMKISHQKARALAKKLGFSHVYWCWEKPRTREGFYPVIGGTDYCVARAHAFTPYCDMIWMETATPNVQECKEFADGVHAKFPNTMLAYNLSPSFNWDAAKMNDEAISQFQKTLGKMGFVWQFITLAGFHTNALHIDTLAKEYSERGVVAYVQTVQREERRLGVETLTHQKWSGAELLDTEMMIATGGTTSTASLEGATESQFTSKL